MTTAVYLRVSSTSQSTESQRQAVTRWLAGNAAGDARWFEDTISGATTDRPALKALEEAIFHGEVDTVVVYRLDRLSRSLRHGIETLCRWTERGVRVVSVTQQIDLSGAVGRMVASILLGLAEIEREAIRERQAAGIQAAKARGVYRGRAPGRRKASPERARELRAQGLRVDEVATALGVSRRTVVRYLGA